MKTYVVDLKSSGEGIEEALVLSENIAYEYHLTKKNSIHLRLLSEEMTGMLRSVTGEMAASFWIEEHDGQFELHLSTNTEMYSEKRAELLSLSTPRKNAEPKGIMGKLRSLFVAAVKPEEKNVPELLKLGSSSAEETWSLNSYKAGIEGQIGENTDAKDAWDELERSIVAQLADEVSISIKGNKVEMTIFKKF